MTIKLPIHPAGIGSLPRGAKCKRCGAQAEIPLPSHHANFCPECFLHFFRTAVQRAFKRFDPTGGEPLLVAVSGGKDSLALWSVLDDLGYTTRGLHIGLGIEGFSEASAEAVERFAQQRGFSWAHYRLQDVVGWSIPEIRRRTRRKICSVCGLLKRRLLDRLTVREGFRVLAVGHNLDDEAGRLLGNLVRNRSQYLERQYPFLPSTHPRLPAKMKPLFRLDSMEIRTYCELRGIQPLQEQCPLARGATSHVFQEALQFLEKKMPGTKRDFLFAYMRRRKPPEPVSDYGSCRLCGDVCYGDTCNVCILLEQIKGDRPGRGGKGHRRGKGATSAKGEVSQESDKADASGEGDKGDMGWRDDQPDTGGKLDQSDAGGRKDEGT